MEGFYIVFFVFNIIDKNIYKVILEIYYLFILLWLFMMKWGDGVTQMRVTQILFVLHD